jgi:hypothetical protein
VADLAAGLTRACASERNGITDRTLRAWVARGKAGAEPFASFASAVKKAERDAEALAVGSIRQVAKGGVVVERVATTDKQGRTVVTEKFSRPEWTAWAWWLERKFPEAWGKDTEILRQMLAEYRRRKKADG